LIHGELTGDAPLDTAISRAVLQRVTSGELDETLQVGTPHRVVAFGKHDSLTDGFTDAVAIARAAGYDPTVRIAGGRAVVFSPTILRFAWTVRAAEPARDMHQRFAQLARAVVAALARLGVASEIGEVPNEYCAGQYSVHVLGHRKVMGVGQRLTRSAAQVGGMIVLEDPAAINDVLVPIYDVLGVAMDPTATGAISDVTEVAPADVSDALSEELADGATIVPSMLDDATLALGRQLRDDHDPVHLPIRRGM
jgi:lipoate-protein ligase A